MEWCADETGGTAITKINAAQILPIAMILLDVSAAAVLNATVTF